MYIFISLFSFWSIWLGENIQNEVFKHYRIITQLVSMCILSCLLLLFESCVKVDKQICMRMHTNYEPYMQETVHRSICTSFKRELEREYEEGKEYSLRMLKKKVIIIARPFGRVANVFMRPETIYFSLFSIMQKYNEEEKRCIHRYYNEKMNERNTCEYTRIVHISLGRDYIFFLQYFANDMDSYTYIPSAIKKGHQHEWQLWRQLERRDQLKVWNFFCCCCSLCSVCPFHSFIVMRKFRFLRFISWSPPFRC